MARILLADDYEPYRKSLTQKLERDGHSVVQAATPQQAAEAFARETFDLVLLDNNMGVRPDGQDGVELTKNFMAEKPDTIIIMITGEKTPQVEREFMLAGGAACFGPMEKSLISYTIESAIKSKEASAHSVGNGASSRRL